MTQVQVEPLRLHLPIGYSSLKFQFCNRFLIFLRNKLSESKYYRRVIFFVSSWGNAFMFYMHGQNQYLEKVVIFLYSLCIVSQPAIYGSVQTNWIFASHYELLQYETYEGLSFSSQRMTPTISIRREPHVLFEILVEGEPRWHMSFCSYIWTNKGKFQALNETLAHTSRLSFSVAKYTG